MRRVISGLFMSVAVLVIAGCTATVGGDPALPSRAAGGPGASTSEASSIPATPSTRPPGTISPATPPSTSPSTSTACPEVFADPSIAFQPALSDGDVLMVGETGWLSMVGIAADVTIAGSPGAVALADRSMASYYTCETATGRSWVEVAGRTPGTVTLTMPGSGNRSITITVQDR